MAKISRHGGATNKTDNSLYSYPVGIVPAGPRPLPWPSSDALRSVWVDYATARGLTFPAKITKARLIVMLEEASHDA